MRGDLSGRGQRDSLENNEKESAWTCRGCYAINTWSVFSSSPSLASSHIGMEADTPLTRFTHTQPPKQEAHKHTLQEYYGKDDFTFSHTDFFLKTLP